MESISFLQRKNKRKNCFIEQEIQIIMLKLAKLSLLQKNNYFTQSDFSDYFGLDKNCLSLI